MANPRRPARVHKHDHPRDAAAGATEPVRVRMLGGFSVSVGARTIGEDRWRLRKTASLVKFLALARGHRLHREQAMDLLWPDLDKRAASNNLRKALHVARATLVPDTGAGSYYLRSEDGQILLCPEGRLWLDLEAFRDAAANARRGQEPAAYRAAIELYAGDLLPGDRYEQWTENRREELRWLYLALLVEVAGLYEEREEYEKGVEALRRLVSEEPAGEEAHAGLMRLYGLIRTSSSHGQRR